MMNWKSLGTIAVVLSLIVIGWQLMYPTYHIRYRITLEAEADGQVVRGSGVLEANYGRSAFDHPSVGGMSMNSRGEAVVLDLGSRGTAFLTLKRVEKQFSYDTTGILLGVFGTGSFPKTHAEVKRNFAVGRRAEVPLDRLFMMVRFKDIADPRSVEQVDPTNLGKSFGAGTRLLRATIEITDDPVTTGIEKRLTWLAIPPRGQRLVRGPARLATEVPPAEFLDYFDFQKDLKLRFHLISGSQFLLLILTIKATPQVWEVSVKRSEMQLKST
jgi:hypothetical protein